MRHGWAGILKDRHSLHEISLQVLLIQECLHQCARARASSFIGKGTWGSAWVGPPHTGCERGLAWIELGGDCVLICILVHFTKSGKKGSWFLKMFGLSERHVRAGQVA